MFGLLFLLPRLMLPSSVTALMGASSQEPATEGLSFPLVYWEASLSHGTGRHPGHGKAPWPTAACETQDSTWCGYSQHSLDAMRITAAYNRADGVHLLTDVARVQNNSHFRNELERAGIEVVNRAPFKRAGSRASQYFAMHLREGQKHPAEMESRFCEFADLAKARGWEGVLTLDTDEVLFSNANDLLRHFTEDVLTPCDECSQVVRWRRAALDRFCDAFVTYWGHTKEERKQLGTLAQPNPEENKSFNDMTFLAIFLKSGRYGAVTQRANATLLSPFYPSTWLGGFGLEKVFGSHVCAGKDSGPMAKLQRAMKQHHSSIRYTATSQGSLPRPYSVSSGEPLAILHFLGAPCKNRMLHRVFAHHYSRLGPSNTGSALQREKGGGKAARGGRQVGIL